MGFDVFKVRRGLERVVLPVEPAEPEVDIRVPVPDGAEVALEMRDINRVEADLRQSH